MPSVSGTWNGRSSGTNRCGNRRQSRRPDGTTFVSADSERVRLWDLATGAQRVEHRPSGPGKIDFVTPRPDGEMLLVQGGGRVQLLAARTLKPAAGPLGQGLDGTAGAHFTPDGKQVSRETNQGLQLWDAATGAARGPLVKLPPRQANQYQLWVGPDGRRCVSVTSTGRVPLPNTTAEYQVWLIEAATGKELAGPIRHQHGTVPQVLFVAGGARVAVCACEDSKWFLHVLAADAGQLRSVALFPRPPDDPEKQPNIAGRNILPRPVRCEAGGKAQGSCQPKGGDQGKGKNGQVNASEPLMRPREDEVAARAGRKAHGNEVSVRRIAFLTAVV